MKNEVTIVAPKGVVGGIGIMSQVSPIWHSLVVSVTENDFSQTLKKHNV